MERACRRCFAERECRRRFAERECRCSLEEIDSNLGDCSEEGYFDFEGEGPDLSLAGEECSADSRRIDSRCRL